MDHPPDSRPPYVFPTHQHPSSAPSHYAPHTHVRLQVCKVEDLPDCISTALVTHEAARLEQLQRGGAIGAGAMGAAGGATGALLPGRAGIAAGLVGAGGGGSHVVVSPVWRLLTFGWAGSGSADAGGAGAAGLDDDGGGGGAGGDTDSVADSYTHAAGAAATGADLHLHDHEDHIVGQGQAEVNGLGVGGGQCLAGAAEQLLQLRLWLLRALPALLMLVLLPACLNYNSYKSQLARP